MTRGSRLGSVHRAVEWLLCGVEVDVSNADCTVDDSGADDDDSPVHDEAVIDVSQCCTQSVANDRR